MNVKDPKWRLLVLALILSVFGVIYIWSASLSHDGIRRKPYMQALFLLVCIPCVVFVLKKGYLFFSRYAYIIYFTLLISLLILLLRGSGNVSRWYNVAFGVRLQPSEFMKLGVIFVLARYFVYPRKFGLTTWRGLIWPLVLVLGPMFLIMKQPDLGTSLVILPVAVGMLYLAGLPGKRLMVFIILALMACPIIYNLPLLKGYQKERITSFLMSIPKMEKEAMALRKAGEKEEAKKIEKKIQKQKRDAGYQQYYSMVSVGSGGLFGHGLGEGPLNRLNRLPERHTDFIFAIIGEEWGFLGCSVILILFFIIVAISLGIAQRTRDPFGKHLCSGVALLFLTQGFFNTAIAVGLLPITGLTLPFVSYGGSSLLSSYLALALVLDVERRRVRVF